MGERDSRGQPPLNEGATDAHLCLTLSDAGFATFCTSRALTTEVSLGTPHIPCSTGSTAAGSRRSRFGYSQTGTLVESWGMPNDQVRAQTMTEHRNLAESSGLALLEIGVEDLPRLPTDFSRWLDPG